MMQVTILALYLLAAVAKIGGVLHMHVIEDQPLAVKFGRYADKSINVEERPGSLEQPESKGTPFTVRGGSEGMTEDNKGNVENIAKATPAIAPVGEKAKTEVLLDSRGVSKEKETSSPKRQETSSYSNEVSTRKKRCFNVPMCPAGYRRKGIALCVPNSISKSENGISKSVKKMGKPPKKEKKTKVVLDSRGASKEKETSSPKRRETSSYSNEVSTRKKRRIVERRRCPPPRIGHLDHSVCIILFPSLKMG
ncbi:unnamed protein product, partial [Iphiclides podalirius]